MTLRMLVGLAVAVIAATGCINDGDVPTEHERAVSAESADETASFNTNGTLWIPPTRSMEGTVTRIPIAVNATGMTLDIDLRKGWRLAGEMPDSMASVMAEVLDPAGDKVAERMMPVGGAETATLHATDLVEGEYQLMLRTWGGSDGSGIGQYVEYRILASLRSTTS